MNERASGKKYLSPRFLWGKLKHILIGTEFMRNVLTLMSGTTIAQAIPFLVSPIISRIYSPEDMDILTLFLGMTGLLAPVITGTYENAIMLPKEDEEAFQVGAVTTLLITIFSAAALPIAYLFNKEISAFQNNPAISGWLYFVPLSIFLIGFYQIICYWSMRKKQYRRIAASRVVQTISTSIVNLGMGFGGLVTSGLVVGTLIGQGLAAAVIGLPAWKDDHLQAYKAEQAKMRAAARKFIDFPRYTLPQTFLDGVKDSGIVFLISMAFLPGTLGAYGFTLKILRAPLNLIGIAIGQVFYQKAADTYNSGRDLMPLLKGVMLRLTVIALPILLILLLIGPQIFALVFGNKWVDAGRYAQILSPWLLLQFISSPVSQIPLILRKQKVFLLVGAGYDLLVPLAFGLAAFLTRDITFSLIILSATASLYLSGIIAWFIWLVKTEGQLKGVQL